MRKVKNTLVIGFNKVGSEARDLIFDYLNTRTEANIIISEYSDTNLAYSLFDESKETDGSFIEAMKNNDIYRKKVF
jgi:hypothetical protein